MFFLSFFYCKNLLKILFFASTNRNVLVNEEGKEPRPDLFLFANNTDSWRYPACMKSNSMCKYWYWENIVRLSKHIVCKRFESSMKCLLNIRSYSSFEIPNNGNDNDNHDGDDAIDILKFHKFRLMLNNSWGRFLTGSWTSLLLQAYSRMPFPISAHAVHGRLATWVICRGILCAPYSIRIITGNKSYYVKLIVRNTVPQSHM